MPGVYSKEGDSDEPTTELVGRQHEMAELAERSRSRRARAGRVRAIMGDPGVGKSRMVQELAAKRLTTDSPC